MKRWIAASAATAVAGAGVIAATQATAGGTTVEAVLRDPRGAHVGSVTFRDEGKATSVRATLRPNRYVAAGAFHGFHVHANNDPANGTGCLARGEDASTWFVSADGHLAETGQTHGKHHGDLPSPLVLRDGTATLRFTTDRIDPSVLVGRAVILHAGPDNFGNVPTGTKDDQYMPNTPAAVEKTQKTGNAGDRVACGTLHRD
jgi:Cu-Zn family superoxide dismutase